MTLEESARDNLEKQTLFSQTGESASLWSLPGDRWISIFLGSGLLVGATARRSLSLALVGGILIYRGAAGRWPFADLLGLTASDDQLHPATSVPHETGIKIERSVMINKSPEELYRFWRALENLPRFMSQVAEVRPLDEKRSHWRLNTLSGTSLEWEAEIINDIPNQLLAWRSLHGADVDHAGSVHFDPGPHGGTNVRVVMEYRPPAGQLGAELARLIGQDPAQILDKDLHSFKQVMETGEITSVAGQPHGAGA